jgi:hypothetical protein
MATPAAIGDATRRDHGNVDSVEHLRDEDRGRHRAGVATTFGPLCDHRIDAPGRHLLGVTPSADGRHDDDTGVLELLDDGFARRLGERRHRDLLGDDMIDALVDVESVGAQVHAKGVARRLLDIAYRLHHLVIGHRRRCDDAQPARVAGGCGELGGGDPTHPGLDDRVLATALFGCPGAQAGVAAGGRVGHLNSALRRPLGSMTSRIRCSSSAVG